METVLEKVRYSFVLPAYKANYLKEAIDSILGQTYTDFELIIVNDASPEDLDSIVNSYNDSRIQYYKNEKNIGGRDLVAQWNHSISYAAGDYLVLASDDDIYALDYLEKMDSLVMKYPDVKVFRPRVNRVDRDGRIFQIDGFAGEYLTQIEYLYLWTCDILRSGIPFMVFNRRALMEIRGFVNYPLAWFSDDATILKLADNGIGVYTEKSLFTFRFSNENISTAKNNKHTLKSKLKATRMFYDEHMSFIQNYVSENPEEEHLLNEIKYNFPRLIRKVKVLSQLRESTLAAIIASIKEGTSIGCISFLNMLIACKYPFKSFFKGLFGKRCR